jgi:flagellar assembly factor FliW
LIKVKTTRFGEIDIDEKDVITLPAGIIGFPELKQYVLLDHDNDSPFKWLQALEDGAIAFVLINPLLFKPDYLVEVNEGEVQDLEIENEEDAVVSVIITMPSDPQKMTANLKAPVIFNLKNHKGRQIILNTSEYTTRHNIMEEMRKVSSQPKADELAAAIEQAKESTIAEKLKKTKKAE